MADNNSPNSMLCCSSLTSSSLISISKQDKGMVSFSVLWKYFKDRFLTIVTIQPSNFDSSFKSRIDMKIMILHIFGKRKETIKLLKEFLGRNLCITLGHTYTAMFEHLAHRFNGHALFKRDKRGKGVSCRMCGKWKRDTRTKP